MREAIHAAETRNGGIINYHSRMLLDHDGNDSSANQPWPLEIDIQHGIPRFFAEFVGFAVKANAGVVKQNVDAAKSFDGFGYSPRNLCVIPDVSHAHQSVGALSFDVLFQRS